MAHVVSCDNKKALFKKHAWVKSGSFCKEAAILRHHISTVAQNVDLLRVLRFHSNTTASVRKMGDHVGHQKTMINLAFSRGR